MPNVLSLMDLPAQPDSSQWLWTQSHKASVQSAVSAYALDFPPVLMDTILSFLNTVLADAYRLYCHGAVNAFINNGGQLCPDWCQHALLHLSGGAWAQRDLKLAVFGEAGAGKTSLVLRWVSDRFEQWDPTIEDTYRKQAMVAGQAVHFDILDTAGSEEFSSMMDRWTRECQVALLCFAIDEKHALKHCVVQFESMLRIWEPDGDHFGRNACLLVACKMDVMYRDIQGQGRRHIMAQNYRMARKLSLKWNVPFVETSALQRMNVEALFAQVVYEYWLQTQTRCVNWYAEGVADLLSEFE